MNEFKNRQKKAEEVKKESQIIDEKLNEEQLK